MHSCPKCDGFSERLHFNTPWEYRDIVRQLIEVVEQGTFVLIHADCPLRRILEPTWPGDSVGHEFECFVCGRKFQLSADTYHGNVYWTPGEIPVPESNIPKPN